jgi:uncharacterized protein YndB with AHSA1/START domain
MPNILHEVTIEAPADKVYKALTEQAGLAAWWTHHTKAEPRVGSIAEFGFYGGQAVFKMKIDTLEPGSTVNWSVQGGGPPDWANTRVTWDLSTEENGTKVLLGHRGFASEDGSFANTNYNWGWFLTSLKSYIETGKGTPNTD